MIINTPEDCIQKLSQSFSTAEELQNALTEITIAHKFKLKKVTGNKKYFYFECYKLGAGRSIEE